MKIPLLAFLLMSGFPTQGFPADDKPIPPAVKTLIQDRGCLACHGLVHKQVGPGFAQVAARYRDDPAAADYLAGRIRNGAVGNWGRLVMPRQAGVGEADALMLARWVLTR